MGTLHRTSKHTTSLPSQLLLRRRLYAAEKIGAGFRVIPEKIPDLEWTGFPRELAEKLTSFRNGLVISCGVRGAGKTTTLAMLLNMLCESDGYRIITIEEPIEYVFPTSNGSVVTQREIGRDVPSFDEGLMYSLRQDPDVILVGEIRDRSAYGQCSVNTCYRASLKPRNANRHWRSCSTLLPSAWPFDRDG